MFLDKTQKAEAAGQQRLPAGREERRMGTTPQDGQQALLLSRLPGLLSNPALGPRPLCPPLIFPQSGRNSPFSLTPRKDRSLRTSFPVDSSCPRPPD